jgi:5'-3' exonuclease
MGSDLHGRGLPYLSATRSVEHTLTEEEQRRNSRRLELVYVGGSHSLAAEIIDACETAGNPNADDSSRLCAARELDPDVSDGMSGLIAPPSGDPCPTIITAPFKGLGEDITTNSVVCGVYLLPPHQPHVSRLLPGAEEDESVVSDSDVGPEPALWHEDRRGPHRNFNHRSNGQQQDRRGPPSQYMVQQSYHASQQQQYGYQAPMYQNYNQPPQGYGYGVQPGYAQQPSYPGGTYNQPPPGYGYSPQQAHYYPHPQQSQYTGQYPAGNYAGGSGGPFMPNPAMLPGQQQGNSAQLQSSNPYAALWRPKRS